MTDEDRKAFLPSVEAAYSQHRPVPGCTVKRLTRPHVHVAYKLAHWRHSHPSHEQLARAAGVCVGTVRNALDALRALGLLDWTRRVISVCGWRAQLANAYRATAGAVQKVKSKALLIRSPDLGTSAVLEAARALIGRFGRAESTPPAPPRDRIEDRKALAAARERRGRQLGLA